MSSFIAYTTVFRSRLGATNLVVKHCSTGYTPEETLVRKVRGDIDEKVAIQIDDPESAPVLEFLVEKGLVGHSIRRSGRYHVSLTRGNEGWIARNRQGVRQRSIEVAATDFAMADPRIPSTVGSPTAENAAELIELTYQLGLIARTKRNLTARGQALVSLRQGRMSENPFLIEEEAAVFMRQLVENDGLMLKQFVSALGRAEPPIKRSVFAKVLFPGIVEAMYDEVATGGYRVDVRREVKAFRGLIKDTAASAARRSSNERGGRGSRGPGVLEHRASPRLEWLCDLRVLTKQGLPSNAFTYRPTPDLSLLERCLWEEPGLSAGPDEVAIAWWRHSEGFSAERAARAGRGVREALLHGYRLIRRPVGPSAIRDVAFLGALFAEGSPSTTAMTAALVEWSQVESGVSLSGGRYRREPELVHVRKDLLGKEGRA